MKNLMMVSMLLSAAFTAFAAPLKLPAKGKIRVAVAITEGATMIDFAGPWEVFQDVHVDGRDDVMPFELYTVSDSRDPIRASGGMKIVPDYTFDDAPVPHVIIVPAQRGSEKLHAWLKALYPKVDVLASVCTGAFQLARAGLLDGKEATTHHDFYERMNERYPKVKLVRSRRFVQSDDVIITAGGLSSGIDLALHVVERYFGAAAAAQTAEYMEYHGDGWRNGAVTPPATAAARAPRPSARK